LRSRFSKWFSERGIDTLDVAGILAFAGLVFGRIYSWLDLERSEETAGGTVKKWFFHTGGLLFCMTAVTVTSGLFLLFYYHPTPESAQASLRYIESSVFFGRTLRQLHAWSASSLIFLIFVHIFKCFANRAYGRPKELNWLVGSSLLFFCFYFLLTGRLLPWDQYSYWKTVANLKVLSDVPVIGSFLVNLLYGGQDVTWITLIRFYSAHVLVLPLVTAALLLLHFRLMRKDHHSSTSAPLIRGSEAGGSYTPRSIFTVKVLELAMLSYVMLGIVLTLAILRPYPLTEEANPFSAIIQKPEWYLLGAKRILDTMPGFLSALALLIVPILFLSLPYFDERGWLSWLTVKLRIALALLLTLFFMILTWGPVS